MRASLGRAGDPRALSVPAGMKVGHGSHSLGQSPEHWRLSTVAHTPGTTHWARSSTALCGRVIHGKGNLQGNGR